MGIALLGSVMNASYAPGLADVPGVPAEEAGDAAHSLGEAYQIAVHLGGPAGESLYAAARHAFVHGLHVTLVVSAGLLLAGAVMALKLPRTMDPAEPAGCDAPAADAVDAAPVRLPAQPKGPGGPAVGARLPAPGAAECDQAVGGRPGRTA